MSFIRYFVAAFIYCGAWLSVDGRATYGDFYDKNGKWIGSDGFTDGKRYIVTKWSDCRIIRKITRLGGTIQEKNVRSSVVLPSDAALHESLSVLQRTEAIGGLKEQSSLVLKDDSVIRGSVGKEASIENNVQTAECVLPVLPDGKSRDDVETTIHPHPTHVTYESGSYYPHAATAPSRVDKGTFAYFTTNIIVGPLEQVNFIGPRRIYGTPAIPYRRMGIAVYYHNGDKPSVILTRRSAERILAGRKT